MRDNLIGFLLEALEPAEQELVEARLSVDAELRRELDLLRHALVPLEPGRHAYDPPPGLAHRTCEFIAAQTRVTPAPAVSSVSTRWSMADLLIAAGLFLAATGLFWPAMNQSRFAAKVTQCQNNLRQIGVALASYSDLYKRQLPAGSADAEHSGAGMYAVVLNEHGLLPQVRILICPASPLVDTVDKFRLPTTKQLAIADPALRAKLRREMGGSYGYSLGFIKDGVYQSPRDLRRAMRALMADAPHAGTPEHDSLNHGGYGQNVLFEDLHVQFMVHCHPKDCLDHIFENDEGQQRAGCHEDDSVIGASDSLPLGIPVQLRGRR